MSEPDPSYGTAHRPPFSMGQSVDSLFKELNETFQVRNKEYGENYRMVGKIFTAMFPDGLTLRTEEDFNRFHLFMLKVVKLTRSANNYGEGGHRDSGIDDIVYTAMVHALEEAARNGQKTI